MTVLRPGLLDQRAVVLAGPAPGPIADALAALGARVHELSPELDEAALVDQVAGAAPLHALVYDAASAFGEGGQTRLRESLERAWVATRTTATGALIPAGAGKVVLITPTPTAGPFASAARAGLENLTRTLSVEWARFGVTAVAIAPGARSTGQELAELVCFLISPAGNYFSGCVFELTGTGSYAPLSDPSPG